MTLPKAISDAIDEFARLSSAPTEETRADARAALERAIADHASPVAPTEAEIEAWRRKARSWRSGNRLPDHATTFRVLASDIEEAVALMRRAAAAKPVYSATGRAFQLHSADWHGSQDEMPKSVLIYGSGDMGRGEFANYLRADVAREAAATPAPSALERLRDKIRSEADNADESYSAGLHRAADMIDEKREREATQRLTDDRLQALRLMLQEHAASWLHTIDRDTLAAMLDEIEERRRIPQFLRLARAARRCLDGSEVDGWHTPLREVDVAELREALGELERQEPQEGH